MERREFVLESFWRLWGMWNSTSHEFAWNTRECRGNVLFSMRLNARTSIAMARSSRRWVQARQFTPETAKKCLAFQHRFAWPLHGSDWKIPPSISSFLVFHRSFVIRTWTIFIARGRQKFGRVNPFIEKSCCKLVGKSTFITLNLQADSEYKRMKSKKRRPSLISYALHLFPFKSLFSDIMCAGKLRKQLWGQNVGRFNPFILENWR